VKGRRKTRADDVSRRRYETTEEKAPIGSIAPRSSSVSSLGLQRRSVDLSRIRRLVLVLVLVLRQQRGPDLVEMACRLCALPFKGPLRSG